jgi:phospholipase/carboxylesterase
MTSPRVQRAALVACALLVLACGSPPEHTAPTLRTLRRGEGDGPVIVMLHGYGSRPEDFLAFSQRTDLPAGTRFIFPYAPEPTHPPVGPEGGYMWWHFPDVFSDPRHLRFEGLPLARTRVIHLLDALQEELHIGSDRIILGGFSQGAMLTMDVALHDARPLAGVMLLSGSLVDSEEWVPRMRSRRGLRVFQAHGRRDEVLPFGPAEELSTRLHESGVDVRFLPFDGAHEVTAEVSAGVGTFIREVGE